MTCAPVSHRLVRRWTREGGLVLGVPDSYLRELVAYWGDGYDWRQAEAAINAHEHYQVRVAGVPVHFLRKLGRGPDPIPLILTHGWRWTFWHWSKGDRPAH
ncbi:epoxide hydrolase N-terminal domain-containing protein [Rhodococcus jostii]|uniref:epoxide hydrolase N-terminal domain-containing protein n=1 Tax=Rhodococcus jostii TaxID=132919 RepID=UPI000A43A8A7|nr:epoxide hydrolase N-terminal domain-containing protein [Rhodococcus jostii]